MGGAIDPEPDSQSPFGIEPERRAIPADGGQACVLYGAAEFSRDTDIAVLAEADNLRQLAVALDRLQAEPIAVPPFEAKYLLQGHAVHFRCRCPDAAGMRIDADVGDARCCSLFGTLAAANHTRIRCRNAH